jgi:hypothetical protein
MTDQIPIEPISTPPAKPRNTATIPNHPPILKEANKELIVTIMGTAQKINAILGENEGNNSFNTGYFI